MAGRGRPKSKTKNKSTNKASDGICVVCNESKPSPRFYTSFNKIHQNGIIPYCKDCLEKLIRDASGCVDVTKVKEVLQLMDKPFLYDLWNATINADTTKNPFAVYMKNVQMPQTKYATWKDSIFLPNVEFKNEINIQSDFVLTQDILNKWGAGYQMEEYQAFEKKYELLKNNYPEKTSMHTEALLKYIRYSVKEEMSTASNDVGAAKSWGQLAKDAATAAKINPSQLSAADLQDGLSTFGQLARAVEQAIDVIPILPKFKERPQDKVDFTIFCYINYVRDLKGLPLCDYKDIWKFYDNRVNENKQKFDFLQDSHDLMEGDVVE